MKKTKKIISLILSLVLCVNLGIGAFSADTGTTVTGPDENGVLTISGSGKVADSFSYTNIKYLKTVTLKLEDGITQIGKSAFYGCSKLTAVYLPASLTEIGDGAFEGCSALQTIYYPGTEESAKILYNGTLHNTALDNAEWVYNYADDEPTGDDNNDEPTVTDPVSMSFSITSAEAVIGSTATVDLKIAESCSRMGATLNVSAVKGEESLPLSGMKLFCSGCSNENNSGLFVLGIDEALAENTTLVSFSFDTTGAEPGEYTVSISGDIYTGDNVPVEATITAGTITVLEPQVTVTWNNYDDTELFSEQVNRGSVPEYKGEEPTKPSSKLYDYVFTGWNTEPAAVNEDTTYTAQFDEVAREYTVNLDCGLPYAEYSVTESGKTVNVTDGSFTADATKTYTVTVSAVGYNDKTVEFSISKDSAGLSVDEDNGTATLSIEAPAKRMGDVDNDGDVDSVDAQTLYSYLAGNLGDLPDDGIIRNGDNIIFNSNVADISGERGISADDILPMLDLITK